MKILLIAVNAKYIHTNLAVLSLKSYAKDYEEYIHITQYSINQHVDYILRDIYKQRPDVIAFSCYIWNIRIIKELSAELKKILPDSCIWFGGPEVSYDACRLIMDNDYLTGIIVGEGEETFKRLAEYYIEGNTSLSCIEGIVYSDEKEGVVQNKHREFTDINKIPFPYDNAADYMYKIIYYETSRGCPFSCGYCLSSSGTGVRFRHINLVKKELMFFLEHKVKQVKFVDRTFNCSSNRAIKIWKFIKDNDNGITNFHFEIAADLLGEEELELLSTLREGLIQLEIGVQSTNYQTLRAINRTMNMDKLSVIVRRINKGRNIHQHLDLIAGLPYEGYDSFKDSFNSVYELEPNQLQLGFLKLLKGSALYNEVEGLGVICKSKTPYEVLYTPWLTYDEVLKLKSIENVLEIYYNTGQFTYSVRYLEKYYETPFNLYEELGDYYDYNGFNILSHSRIQRYDILLEFVQTQEYKNIDIKAFKEILIYDLYLRENLKSRPEYASDYNRHKDKIRNFYTNDKVISKIKGYEGCTSKQISRMTHIEYFSINIKETVNTGITKKKDTFVLFDYKNRNLLTHEAKTMVLEMNNEL